MPVESEYQVAEDTKKYRRCHQEAGYLIEKPEESPETDMATAVHTGDTPLEYR